MWHTPYGPKTLEGPMAELLRHAIADMLECLGDDDADASLHKTEVDMFDELSRGSRLALLARVGTALLCKDTAPPPKLAVNDATVAAIFNHMKYLIVIDYETESTRDRELVIAASH